MQARGTPFCARPCLGKWQPPGPRGVKAGVREPGRSNPGCWELNWLQGLLQMLGIALQAARAHQSSALTELV